MKDVIAGASKAPASPQFIELPSTVAALVLAAAHGPAGYASHPDGHEAQLFYRQPSREKVVRLSLKKPGEHERVWITPPETMTLPLGEPVSLGDK